jgi:hypothetical protein
MIIFEIIQDLFEYILQIFEDVGSYVRDLF